MDYITKARTLVYEHVKDRFDKSDPRVAFDLNDVYVVWFSKTLQNWKALLSTTHPDLMYYEVTYNGNDKVAYIDAYRKFMNVAVQDEEN